MKPAILCKLTKGTIIDANPGFVETFNWLVDFCNNLQGDGDRNKARKITLDKSDPDHPVVRFNGAASAVAADQFVVVDVEWVGIGHPDYAAHPCSLKISRGRLALNPDGEIAIDTTPRSAADVLDVYIPTTPLSSISS